MRFDSFDFLSPVVGKAISKSESVMDLNSETKPDAKVKKTKPECDLMPAKPFGTIGEYLCFVSDLFTRPNKLFSFFISTASS